MTNGTNGSQSNGDKPEPNPVQKLTELAHLSEQVTELKQQVQDIYGDEDDWERMSKHQH